ncbi:recombinase family protein [Methylomagnum ishizawai]|uniref:recombinase family protein n=1 Tax=Methylomagnum ishizawai TaxID=1760988 RepID=UPI001C81C282|nr:recombinase family protein [Methylomagnum ishizawai]
MAADPGRTPEPGTISRASQDPIRGSRHASKSGLNPQRRGDNYIEIFRIHAGRADILLLEGLDRLSRDMVEQETIIRDIEARGVRIVGLSDGYDSKATRAARTLQRGLRGMLNELYLIDLAAKTHRGLSGQVQRGHHAGGLAYGYRTVREADNSRLEIHPEQAAIIREIHRRYAAGESCQRIVADLNRRHVPSPRGTTWAVSALYGSPNKGTGILNNETFTGRYLWNRSQWIKDPKTGTRQRIERPRAEWQIQDRPDLRIVDAETWAAVRQRIDTPRLAGGTRGKGGKPTTLFGGLLTCGHCGGAVVAINDRLYGCAARKDRGRSVCPGIYVPRDILDKKLLGLIREHLTSPDALAEMHTLVREALHEQRRQADAHGATAQARLIELEKEIGNLVGAIAQVGLSAALQSRLAQAEREREALHAVKFSAANIGKVEDVMAQYRRRILDLRTTLSKSPTNARMILKEYLKEIRLEADQEGIYAQIKESPASLLSSAGGAFLGLVAGAGFHNQSTGGTPHAVIPLR